MRLSASTKGIYTIFTTFVLVIIMVIAILSLTYLNQKMISIQEKKARERMQLESFRNVKEQVHYCYGNIIDEAALVSNPGCLHLQGDQGISIRRLAFGACSEGQVEDLNYRGYGMVNVFQVPIYDKGNQLVCPAELTVYEHAVKVPLLESFTATPPVAVAGEQIQVVVDFHPTSPSFIDLVVRSPSGSEVMRKKSGALNSNSVSFQIDTSSLLGLYNVNAMATQDQEYYDSFPTDKKIRVVGADDKPSVKTISVIPSQGTIYNKYILSVNLTDYLDITQAEAVISLNGAEVGRIVLSQQDSVSDKENLELNIVYEGSWDASSLQNQNQSYTISISATNRIGNNVLAQDVGIINISEQPKTQGDVLIVTNERVYSSLGTALQDYQAALAQDGYTSLAIRLDNADDIKLCGDTLSPAQGPVISSDQARQLIPPCIVQLESKYVLILGGHSQVQQYLGGAYKGNDYYTEDYYADIDGNGYPDVPIGRLPDGTPPGDNTVQKALQTAINMHSKGGWQRGGSHYAWTLDDPKGGGSPTNKHIECIVMAMDKNNAPDCDSDPKCYFSPPYNLQQTGLPPGWGATTDMLYLVGHGEPGPSGPQTIRDQNGKLMGTSKTMGQRDFANTIFFYNPCLGGRIHNHDFDGSSILHALSMGAVTVFGGTTLQEFDAKDIGSCPGLPVPRMDTGSIYMTNLAYELNKGSASTIGDAWLKKHNQVTKKHQREHNVMYGDPSIRVK